MGEAVEEAEHHPPEGVVEAAVVEAHLPWVEGEVVAVAEEPHPKVAGEAGAPAEPSSDAKEAAEGLRSWAAGAQEAEAARH